MSQETINIEIVGRSYPLTVSLEEVDGIISAAEEIDAMIANLKSQFAVQDRNDFTSYDDFSCHSKLKRLKVLEVRKQRRNQDQAQKIKRKTSS